MGKQRADLDAYTATHPGVSREAARKRLGPAIIAERPAPISLNARRNFTLQDGIILAAGDAHYWPSNQGSTAHRALVHMCTELAPAALILMGDIIDGSRISRWPLGAWEDATGRPTPAQEVAVAQERLRELREAVFMAKWSPGSSDPRLFWVMGNHDARFESYLVENAPEFVGMEGTRLKDHFPSWQPCWSVRVNDTSDTPTVFKHRWKGGVHAAHNNAVASGCNIVTGHLHSLKVSPYSDYRGTRYGVDTGTLAVPYGAPFVNYTEDAPTDWRSGFAVLTYTSGKLLWPEVCHVVNEAAGLVSWRGKILKV